MIENCIWKFWILQFSLNFLGSLILSIYEFKKSFKYGYMVVRVVEFSREGYKDCCLKINIPKGNFRILRIGVMGNCQKLGIILVVIKWFQNWCYQKMSMTKNVLLNWYSSMKKRWERFRWFLKVKFWHFLTPSQIQ